MALENSPIEVEIISKLAQALIAAGFTITVCDEEERVGGPSSNAEQVMSWCFHTGATIFHVRKTESDMYVVGSIWFIHGNEEDVVADHTVNLEHIVDPVLQELGII